MAIRFPPHRYPVLTNAPEPIGKLTCIQLTRVSATKKSPTNIRNRYFLADHRKSHDHLLSPRCAPTFRNPPSGNDKLSHTACFNQSHVKLFITWTAFSCCNQSHYELFDDQVEVSRTQHLG